MRASGISPDDNARPEEPRTFKENRDATKHNDAFGRWEPGFTARAVIVISSNFPGAISGRAHETIAACWPQARDQRSPRLRLDELQSAGQRDRCQEAFGRCLGQHVIARPDPQDHRVSEFRQRGA
ncbi:MAG: hypothetical protein MZV70_53050 [Desulfobacterales bacterium]|nr:hypothetical protein [Desulfobacterales bacterium]